MFEGGEIGGGVIGSQSAFVVAEDHVENPVEAVFDGPVIADEGAEETGGEGQ